MIKKSNIIIGPCAMESKEQMDIVCKQSLNLGFVNIRASIYKPRTSSGCFEGLKDSAFPIVEYIRKTYPDINLFTEIPDGTELKKCIDHGIENFWIGSRTATNPFSVQSIADAIKDINPNNIHSIGIKNPMNKDAALWIGAYNRIKSTGIQPYMIFRGISTGEENVLRNSPDWDFVNEVKIALPSVKFILDPSHIAGKSSFVPSLTIGGNYTGLFDGAIIEVHPNPTEALTDAKQQLTFDEIDALAKTLDAKIHFLITDSEISTLNELRNSLDSLDYKMHKYFQKYLGIRRVLTDRIGEIKAEHSESVYNPKRIAQIFENIDNMGFGQDAQIHKQIFKLIHKDSVNRQLGIMSDMNKKMLF